MPDISCPLAQAAIDYGDQIALVSDKDTINYRRYNQLVASTAVTLRQKGVQPHSRVAIIADNCIEYPILLMALIRLGAVACPVSTRWPTEMILSYMTRIGCSHLIAEEWPIPAALRLRSGRLPARKPLNVQTLEVVVRLNVESDAASSNVTLNTNQDATIIATSGTTKSPKGVLHTFGNHYSSALGSNKNIALGPGDRWLVSLPLYHVGGLAILFRTILAGAAVVIPAKSDNIASIIKRDDASHLSLVPTQLHRLMRDRAGLEDARRVKAILVGGGYTPEILLSEAVDNGLPVHTTYGLTEMASQVTTSKPEASPAELRTSGKLLPYRELRISENGEILVRGDTLFRGYVESDRLRLTIDDKGWFHTGDMGALDDEGCLTVHGRQDNMFISGGENIYPEPIEAALLSIEGVEESVVVGVSDAEFGYRPVAFVRMSFGVDMDTEKLRLRLRLHLPGHMLPVAVYPWPEETNSVGLKPDRWYMTELAQELQSSKDR
ncbi:MAG: o-succinylbenzoate--CoA ligase [Thermoprotei archaeon]|nr:MAG: o-succinylbenzoate--CoA ligase [Thermoprotei archaeon]